MTALRVAKMLTLLKRTFLLTLVCLAAPNPAPAEDGWLSVDGPCRLSFPRDHGAHPGYRTEWWYYTGNLATAGREFGFQLTFFRSQVLAPGREVDWPRPPSAWRTRQMYMAHAAVSDLAPGRHLQSERMARGALGLAGVDQSGGSTRVHLLGWQALIQGAIHQLQADADDFRLELELASAKAPVSHGDAGYSRKGQAPDRASCYYSLTRLKTRGSLRIGEDRFQVAGESWMDHEFSTAPLEPGIRGWDWFSLQLSDGSEIMVYLLRLEGGGWNPASSGTYVDAAGNSRHLARHEFSVEVLDVWASRRSQAEYPSRWRMRVPRLALDLEIVSRLADQEMLGMLNDTITYWEGSVAVEGRRNGQPVAGLGYVELTGYARGLDAPM
jgi:predicted secreted hydrolase